MRRSSTRSATLFAVGLVASLGAIASGCATQPWGCSDGVQDGAETGPDCGGGCAPCGLGLGCAVDGDCRTGRCLGGQCREPAYCSDGQRDHGESDVDCGGSCARCALGRRCTIGAECTSNACSAGVCVLPPNCGDGLRNGTESDVDCGGATCPPCATAASCRVPSDCATSLCERGTCHAQPCSDGVQDGAETDVDCGGGVCAQCSDGAVCRVAGDCLSGICKGGTCAVLTSLCQPGYKQNQAKLCVCDPATCGSCCDVNDGNGCGIANRMGGSNCGSHGQTCFTCDIRKSQNCEHSTRGDYCAVACDAAACGGCCSDVQAMLRRFCLHGDEDWACGVKGALCVACPLGQRCVNGACLPGSTDGGL